jgi:hypothetical protein
MLTAATAHEVQAWPGNVRTVTDSHALCKATTYSCWQADSERLHSGSKPAEHASSCTAENPVHSHCGHCVSNAESRLSQARDRQTLQEILRGAQYVILSHLM